MVSPQVKPRPDDILAVLCALYNLCRRGGGTTSCHQPFERIMRASHLPGDRFRATLQAMTTGKAARILNRALREQALNEEPLVWEKSHGRGSFSYGLTRQGAMIAREICNE